MIEVGQNGIGEWAFTLISSAGRILVYAEGFPTQGSAIAAAKAVRAACWARADDIDHRQARCI